MKQKRNIFVRLFLFLWAVVNNTRKLILNLIVFGIILAVIVASNYQAQQPQITNAALLLNIQGNIVEQKQPHNPVQEISQELSGGPVTDPETLLSDITQAINTASNDDNIKMLVIDSTAMGAASLAKLQTIGRAITAFKLSNKPVYAIGGGFNQRQYYLASYADKILMNHKGMVSIEGFGRYRLYHKSLFDKLKVNTHIFRVGTYKSALEPYMRDDMSQAARLANQAWLDDLWQAYVNDVSTQREITPAQFDLSLSQLIASFKRQQVNFAEFALSQNLVDVIDTDAHIIDQIAELVGYSKNGLSFNKIPLRAYQGLNNFSNPLTAPANIAVVIAKGMILNGHQPSGTIGGVSTSLLLRQARLDDNIRAVVLRIDSGGGSAYASEQIRQEVLALQAAGKPVVASMGSVAASGGYWIAASADKIIAQSTTITGSIGIFGMINTFEDSLAQLGVYTDGVATKELAGITITRDLPAGFSQLMQTYIEHGYQEFISLVAQARNMSVSQVDNVAQGRVWSGTKALQHGLVDSIGDLDEAIVQAAELAQLDQFESKIIEKKLSPMELFYQQMMSEVIVALGIEPAAPSPLTKLFSQLTQQFELINRFDDPQHVYLYCQECSL